MGLLPQLRTSAFKALQHHREQPQKQRQQQQQPHHRLSFTKSLSPKHSPKNQSSPELESPLPQEAQQLKDAILASHPTKLVRFSFSHMKHVATPPVELPKSVASARATSTVVAGKSVPFTKSMHANAKKKASKRQMNIIDEYVTY
ncbi:hypothetical protein Gpo141_00013884 [Globisporangium polare]